MELARQHLDAGRFREFLSLFKDQEEAFEYYVSYVSEKPTSPKADSNARLYRCTWSRIYDNFFFIFYSRHKEFIFDTTHYLDKKEARQLQLWKSLGELARFGVMLLAMVSGILLIYGSILMLTASNGRGNLVSGIAYVGLSLTLIVIEVFLHKKSLAWAMPAEMRSVGRGFFTLKKIQRAPFAESM